ncbi:salicylate synthase [Streptomyces sp. CA-249302]|uniref:salicylate synthase n=1 Tax=Streptomyces sp. CA-249302 TaxID=3240058 RepID=UPI003D8FC59B
MTTTHLRYRETRLPRTEDPLTLIMRLVCSGLFDPYVVYERDGAWSLAGGALASVRLGPDAHDLAEIEERFATMPVAGWRAYGWAAFELGPALAGLAPETDGDLLHLIVPADEIRVYGDDVLVRSVDPAGLEAIVALIDAPAAETEAEVLPPIDLPLSDTGNYRAAVSAALVELNGPGPLEKVILSRRVPVPMPVDLITTYALGRRANTPARSFLLNLGGIRAAGFSPETVVEVSADGHVRTHPLAGTRARTGSPTEDALLRADLLSDPKEIHEHAVSVRLALDEMSTVCDDTYVSEYMTVEERGTVQHLASRVTGRLRPGLGPWHAFAAMFPSVTATGIPKAPAYPLIHGLEGRPRGLYSGAVITCDASGALDAALVLRTVYEREGECWLQAGAGVVRQSRPEREHEETCEKLRSVRVWGRR